MSDKVQKGSYYITLNKKNEEALFIVWEEQNEMLILMPLYNGLEKANILKIEMFEKAIKENQNYVIKTENGDFELKKVSLSDEEVIKRLETSIQEEIQTLQNLNPNDYKPGLLKQSIDYFKGENQRENFILLKKKLEL